MPNPKRTARSSVKPSFKTSVPSPPSPFTPAPTTLTIFLSTLSPSHIYLTSLDTHPPAFKRRIFLVPLFLNTILTFLLLYRLSHAIPTYASIFIAVLGYDSPAKLDTKNMDAVALFGILGERVLMFMGDFVLARFVGMWPLGFFWGIAGEDGPVWWRWGIGFREVEVVVRRSRKWALPLFEKEDRSGEERSGVKEEFLEQGKEGQLFRERVMPAVERGWVKNKTSYLMLDKSWDLYFSGMLDGHALIDEGQNKIEDFKTAVLLHSEQLGWLIWEVWKEHDDGSGDEGTRKLQSIKDKLTVMGKENLFFRWIEVVQSETSQPGPFTAEKQKRAVRKIKDEFQDAGVDFDDFWTDVGGVENMPGMEITG